jgi:hypothetical protein
MKQLEVSFSEADMKEALEAYLNRHFVSHRQVRVFALKPTVNSPRSMTAIVVPIEEPERVGPIALCGSCAHPETAHLNGELCQFHNCPCTAFIP